MVSLGKPCHPVTGAGQREVQTAKEFVVEHIGALGCEQRHVLNDFLSVDSSQPLSDWCVSQIHFIRMGCRFLHHISDSRFQA